MACPRVRARLLAVLFTLAAGCAGGAEGDGVPEVGRHDAGEDREGNGGGGGGGQSATEGQGGRGHDEEGACLESGRGSGTGEQGGTAEPWRGGAGGRDQTAAGREGIAGAGGVHHVSSATCPVIGSRPTRSGTCEIELYPNMFGAGVYIDCIFVWSSELELAAGQEAVCHGPLTYELVGDACTYLQSHPDAVITAVYLSGPHGGP